MFCVAESAFWKDAHATSRNAGPSLPNLGHKRSSSPTEAGSSLPYIGPKSVGFGRVQATLAFLCACFDPNWQVWPRIDLIWPEFDRSGAELDQFRSPFPLESAQTMESTNFDTSAQNRPNLTRDRPNLARNWPTLANIAPELAKLGPEFGQTRPTSARNRPQLARNRPNLVPRSAKAARHGSTSKLGTGSSNVGPDIDKLRSDFGLMWATCAGGAMMTVERLLSNLRVPRCNEQACSCRKTIASVVG